MFRLLSFSVVAIAAMAVGLAGFKAPAASKASSKKGYPAVEAIFKTKCLSCHSGPNAARRFDVSSYAMVMKGSNQGKMVIPGKAGKSPLVDYLKGKRKPLMPLGGRSLSAAQIKVVEEWINGGAKNK